ncbi:hypothetical protein NC652_036341 [Populus alba x Populus x berolinensis]|nr:hypothetical protein NC652_036341 [Populus alba x Populus x berolinensis]
MWRKYIVQKKIKTQDITKYLVLDHSRIGAKEHWL